MDLVHFANRWKTQRIIIVLSLVFVVVLSSVVESDTFFTDEMAKHKSRNKTEDLENSNAFHEDSHLSFIVLGASGDLAKKKTFPALMKLFEIAQLPKNISIIGYARSEMESSKFKETLASSISSEEKLKASFLDTVSYFQGHYDSADSFKKLHHFLVEKEKGRKANRIFYFAVPPDVYITASEAIHNEAISTTGYTRFVLEKPFGEDSESSKEMSESLTRFVSEKQLYRVDHYLGKDMVQNLVTMRFSNIFYEPLWNRHYIKAVIINFEENIGTEGRAGYFDKYGIIRDVMQNHLLQMLALIAMEPPSSFQPHDLKFEKTKVLRATSLDIEDIAIGQFTSDGTHKGYLEEEGVKQGSLTPTFAAAVVRINTIRWSNVPFLLRCGKGLRERKTEIIIQFHKLGCTLFDCNEIEENQLIINVQPNEGIYMRLNTKAPGITDEILCSDLDLPYKSRFEARLPDAYERIIHDIIRGDKSLFVTDEELQAAWNVVTPALKHLEENNVKPEGYTFGSEGPSSAEALWRKYGIKCKSSRK